MLIHTRRRALALLLAAVATPRFLPVRRAAAVEDKTDCYDSKEFGEWIAQATHEQAGARLNQVTFSEESGCDLGADMQVATSYDAKLSVFGDAEGTPLPKEFLIEPANRLIVWREGGEEAVNEPLCGNCTDIIEDTVSIVLPLSTAPLFREQDSVDMAIRLGGKEDCRFTIDSANLREALSWAEKRRDELAEEHDNDRCVPPEELCFITTACCQVLGLNDACFELRALRRYRDDVLAAQPGGKAAIAHYYEIAPAILGALPAESRGAVLRSVYARFILPAALAANFGFTGLAYRLYARMMDELARNSAHAPAKPCGVAGGLPDTQGVSS